MLTLKIEFIYIFLNSAPFFSRYGYLKKIIEEVNAQEDTKKLLQFCSWENPTFSHAVLYELLWQVAIAYTYELRPYLDLLLNILLMEDSWQLIRIKKTLKGIPDEHTAREGLFTFTDHRWRCCVIQIFCIFTLLIWNNETGFFSFINVYLFFEP